MNCSIQVVNHHLCTTKQPLQCLAHSDSTQQPEKSRTMDRNKKPLFFPGNIGTQLVANHVWPKVVVQVVGIDQKGSLGTDSTETSQGFCIERLPHQCEAVTKYVV